MGRRRAASDARTQSDDFNLQDGRDELNLAEFPLAALADRVPNNQKTLVFEDRIYDSGKAETITRRLTISASDKYGLPTSLDDEVILGLIQLTKQNRFADRTVHFSRYQLIDILGWRHEGRSYARLSTSLKRWLGVTLYYDKAWWDKDAQSWVDESFHILEQLTLYDQDRRLRTMRHRQGESPLSSFAWNQVVFRSFKSGYLKALDLTVLRGLKHAAAKRIYRFLDKRFYHKPRWEFDLVEFACEHIGLSRSYDTAQLKRRLQPALEELEAGGFLEQATASERYLKISRGDWRIVVSRRPSGESSARTSNDDAVIETLTSRGVTPSVACKLAATHSATSINEHVKNFDERLRSSGKKVMQNPAGFLVKAIRDNYSSPTIKPTAASVRASMKQRIRLKEIVTPDLFDGETKAYLQSLSAEETERLEQSALARADSTLGEGYRRSKRAGGAAHAAYRQMLLEREAQRVLEDRDKWTGA